MLGVIGRNGGGKSTLLKVMSRITEPTTGRVDLYGRVGSLLEVGTGFHPELTGRENIFLSGAILGMRRNEIERKFDEIVAFAEMDQFVDTPVKHYSSGMYVRLGFAVAAHLETEIILIDEVLAVGDAAFQKKCLRKIGDVARQGRTVLYISHNLASVESLCDSCIYLSGGRLEEAGKPRDVIAKYMASQTRANSGTISLADHPGRRPGYKPHLRISGIAIRIQNCGRRNPYGRPADNSDEFRDRQHLFGPVVGVIIKTIQGMPVCSVNDRYSMQLRDCKIAVPRDGSLRDRQADADARAIQHRCVLRRFWSGAGCYIRRDLVRCVARRTAWQRQAAAVEPGADVLRGNLEAIRRYRSTIDWRG